MTRWIDQDRPIVFFDLETTGTNRTTDRIVEIALVRIDVNGAERGRPRLQLPFSSKGSSSGW